MALKATIALVVNALLTKANDLGVARDPLKVEHQIELEDGTGAGEADLIWHDRRTLAASATEDLDVAGVLASTFGVTLAAARIKAIIIVAAAANTNNVNVTRPASNGVPLFLAASDGIAVRPGGIFLLGARDATAVPVTASTGDLITLTNSSSGTPVTFDVIIIGASA